jgi:hypothetical protein
VTRVSDVKKAGGEEREKTTKKKTNYLGMFRFSGMETLRRDVLQQ